MLINSILTKLILLSTTSYLNQKVLPMYQVCTSVFLLPIRERAREWVKNTSKIVSSPLRERTKVRMPSIIARSRRRRGNLGRWDAGMTGK